MNISSIRIEGFGTFSNEDIGPFHEGLNVVLGENEAGKSTLLDFVRGVLYGFVDQRSPKSFHEPLRGGRHGGSISVVDERGMRWTIERIHKRPLCVTTNSGEQEGEAALHALVGHTDKKSFESIFAFGLDELSQAERLHEEGVRDLIFSAGVAGAGRSASLAIRQLEDERSEITRNTRSGDQKNRLHQLVKEREEISDHLRVARIESGSYTKLAHEIDLLSRRADEAFSRHRQLEQRKDQLEDIARAESSIRQRDGLVAQLSGLAEIDDYEQRLIDELRAIDELRIRFEGHERNLAERSRQSQEMLDREAKLGALRERIGLGDDQQEPVEITLGTRSEIAELTTSYHAAQLEIRTLQERHTQALAEFDDHRNDLHRLIANRDPAQLDGAQSKLREIPTLRTMLSQLRELDHNMELSDQRDGQIAPVTFNARKSSQLVFGAVILLGIAAIIFGIAHSHHGVSSTMLFGIGALVVAVTGIVLIRSQSETVTPVDGASGIQREQRDALASRIADRAVSLGLVAHPTDAELEEFESQLREIERDSESIRNALRNEERASDLVRHVAIDLQNWTAEMNRLRDQAAMLSKELGLLRSVGPDALEDVARSIDDLHEMVALSSRSSGQLHDLEDIITRFYADVASLFERCGVANQKNTNLAGVLDDLANTCNEVVLRRVARDELVGAIETIDGQLSALFGRYGNSKELQGELVQKSSTDRELEMVDVRVQLEESKDDYKHLLEERLAHKRDLESITGSTSIADLEIALATINAEIETTLRRWTLLGVSSSLLKRTLHRYEIERQPEVVGRAAELFAQVTNGRYTTLLSREDDQQRHSLRVIRNDGTMIDAQFLSKGTAEQLYLCVRLAYAATFAERSVALPLVFDDVLVNFDPVRCAQMARAIATVAHNHQILLFTCHPNIAETFKATGEALHMIELHGRA